MKMILQGHPDLCRGSTCLVTIAVTTPPSPFLAMMDFTGGHLLHRSIILKKKNKLSFKKRIVIKLGGLHPKS